MSKILIYRYIDIFNNTDYSTLHIKVNKDFGGECPNFGNKLWYQGIISEISTKENEIDFYNGKDTPDEISNRYDLVIYPMANIFSLEFSSGLDVISDFIEKLSIPIYIISCGVQADSYDDLKDLCSSIGYVSKRFIKAVYNTGGQFALRGYFTAEFFKNLGFNNPAVVGCPSLFQCGRNLKIIKKNICKNDFKPALNGNLNIVGRFLKEYSNSIFYDQDGFYKLIYNPDFFSSKKSDFFNKLKLLRYNNNGFLLANLISNNRLKLIADMWDWKHDMIEENINFSFGTRIHGNIMALLAGVPSIVIGFDTRTREMAEFYDIPCLSVSEVNDVSHLFDIYERLDYDKFNKSFSNKFDDFNDFLVKYNIVDKINENNKFMKRESNFKMKYENALSLKYANEIMDKKLFYMLFEKLINVI